MMTSASFDARHQRKKEDLFCPAADADLVVGIAEARRRWKSPIMALRSADVPFTGVYLVSPDRSRYERRL